VTNQSTTSTDDAAKTRKAYSAATRRLREAHKDEFNGFMREEAKRLGVDWAPRLTPEQKAEQEFDRLLEEHPHLRAKVTG
jgi:hypothetical protein